MKGGRVSILKPFESLNGSSHPPDDRLEQLGSGYAVKFATNRRVCG